MFWRESTHGMHFPAKRIWKSLFHMLTKVNVVYTRGQLPLPRILPMDSLRRSADIDSVF